MMELLTSLEGTAFSTWLREAGTIWAYPTVLTLHTVGLAILVGANAAFDLRLLGFGQAMELRPMEKLFRIMWIGFWINAVSGAMLFAADATTKGTTMTFFIKLGFVTIGVVVILWLRRAVYRRPPGIVTVTSTTRALAVVSLLIWIAAIATGRLMAYPELFASWSD